MQKELADILIENVQNQYPDYTVTRCAFHSRRSCFSLLNTFDEMRFHCLFANTASVWRSYSVTKSCDLPNFFYDLIDLNHLLGDAYVLPFASHFRERSGFTVAMYRQNTDLHRPSIIDRPTFKRMVFALVVLYVAVGWIRGGYPPEIKFFSLVYTQEHPVLCSIGNGNGVKAGQTFNRKRWIKFLRRKKMSQITHFLKLYYPQYFQKKKKAGKRCMLNDSPGMGFDDLTHGLLCPNTTLIEVLHNFKELMPDSNIRNHLIPKWIRMAQPIQNK